MQFTGLTAVMKIMFGKGQEALLTRNEIVGLINLTGKLSNSLKWYTEWMEKEQELNFHRKIVYYTSIFSIAVFNFIMFRLFNKNKINAPKQNEEAKEVKSKGKPSSNKRKID